MKGTPQRAGFLIFETESLEDAYKLIADDPFAVEGLIENLTVSEWDPLSGIFAAESSGALPGLGPVA